MSSNAHKRDPNTAIDLTPNPLSRFFMDKDALRLALISAQFALRATRDERALEDAKKTPQSPTGLLVLVNGMEQAGKGTAVTQLRQWVDPRLLKVSATIGYPPLAYQPIWQSHAKSLPRHGDVKVYFGNWYADLLYEVMRLACDDTSCDDKTGNDKTEGDKTRNDKKVARWEQYLRQQLITLDSYEQDLQDNHTKLLKCWFHVDAKTLKQRLNDDKADPQFLYQIDWQDDAVLAQFNEAAAMILREQGDWVIIDGSDKSKAARTFCHHVLYAMEAALDSSQNKEECDNQHKGTSVEPFTPVTPPASLTDIDDPNMDKDDYHKQLEAKQARIASLLRARGRRHVVFAFEGMDAAGKGGAIKRLVAPLDPREYKIYNIGAPMRYELEHPYLWRFWTRLPNEQTERISRIAIFDRTWYGRVLVERIEHFATDSAWQRAYDEINRFESDLTEAGTILIKYWLAIDKDEQLERFKDRQDTPHKRYKLTDDDWRNRDKWEEYVQAAADMLARTNTAAPWCVVATNDKRCARLEVLDHAIAVLSAHIEE